MTWVWPDGSARTAARRAEGTALWSASQLGPSARGLEHELRQAQDPVGAICSRTRAELVALRAALEELTALGFTPDQERHLVANAIIVCLNSRRRHHRRQTRASGAVESAGRQQLAAPAAADQPRPAASHPLSGGPEPTVICPETSRPTLGQRRSPRQLRSTGGHPPAVGRPLECVGPVPPSTVSVSGQAPPPPSRGH